MKISQTLLIVGLRILTKVLIRVHADELSKVPYTGPLIIVSNHTNTAEVGILYGLIKPRPVSGFMAEYRWDALWSRWIGTAAEAIPLHRGEADIHALKQAIRWLEAGKIIAIAPEGTRSKDGRLQKGHPGAVLLALKTNAPMLPLVFYGHENWVANIKRFHKTDFYIKVGKPIRLKTPPQRVTSEIRQRMIDEVMYRLAMLLPEANRGVYADLSNATSEFIEVG